MYQFFSLYHEQQVPISEREKELYSIINFRCSYITSEISRHQYIMVLRVLRHNKYEVQLNAGS